ncbi:MAG TPA: cell division protein FtsZ [Cyclobacteriaceae bacterium]|nr:cell division protein FtsZ [Cyclobacteriaceae bacterium]
MFDKSTYKFEIPKQHKSIIKVIGVGGGGSNAVNHMFYQGIKDVEFVVCNTDQQALNSSPVPYKLQIGANLTEGLGCGANPEVGKNAAIESRDLIREMLDDGTKMVFITAGMGGGTGTGAAPVIAKIARDMEILTVGIITMPFQWEGKRKFQQAMHGVETLRQNCDTVLVILNDKLREVYGNLGIAKAFAEADNVLTTAAKGIAEIITLAGYVNVDFQDVRTVMLEAGAAVMGSAETRGENRARKAAEEALASPLLDNRDIMGAKKILLSIISGVEAELSMDELSEITEFIQEQAGDDAEVIFGHGLDADLGDRIRVTVIATGFNAEGRQLAKSKQTERKVHDLDSSQISIFDLESNPIMDTSMEPVLKSGGDSKPVIKEEEEEKPVQIPLAAEQPRTYEFDLSNHPRVEPANEMEDSDDEMEHAEDDDFSISRNDEMINQEGMVEPSTTKQRLEQQAKERREKLKKNKGVELSQNDYKERWEVPAFVRKGTKVDHQVPHSSEPFISKFNLNDDNMLLGNNKYLHDNVD